MSRVALVTGSSRGIGKATVTQFAKAGYDVAVAYAHSDAAANAVKKQLTELYNVRVLTVKADLGTADGVAALVRAVREAFGRIDVLINNAGIAFYNPFAEKSEENWMTTMKINVVAPFMLSRAVGEIMMEQKYGKIINIASVDATYNYTPDSVDYDASKAAVVNMTGNLALQFAPYVNVNSIAPGWVNTDMNKDLPQELVDMVKQRILKQRFAEPEEIGKLAVFLAGDDSEFINGQCISIDGGHRFN